MLDGEKVSGKANNSLKTNNTTIGNTSANNVFSSSDIEEEFDEGFPGPSTSNYNNGNGIDDLSLYNEDLDVKDHGNARQMFAEFRHLLDHDSVFHRIRSEVLDDLDRMAQEQQSIDSRQLSNRQRFEYLERLDDLLDTASDLNEAHIAVLRHVAIQLSSHAPLEVMTNDFDLEQLFVVPEKQKENGFVEESPPKKIRKTRNVLDLKAPTATASKSQQNTESNHVKTATSLQATDTETPKPKEVKEPTKEIKTNGITTNNDNNKTNGRPESSVESSTKSSENEKPSSIIELAEVKIEDQTSNKSNNSSSKFDSDNSSNVDVKETRSSSDKAKKMELKKPFKKPVNNKPNGVSKPVKSEKLVNRRASERQNSKSSRTPEPPEIKKPKRRAASAAISENSNETNNIANTRQASQRRTRNAQINSELSNIDEQTYCICDQISYGQMVCCDNLSCKIEWFHFDCVGLKVKPGKGQKWFCPSCRGGTSTTMRSAKK